VDLAVGLVIRWHKRSPIRSGQHLVALHAAKTSRMPSLSLHFHLLCNVTPLATAGTGFVIASTETRLSTRARTRAGSSVLGGPGASRARKSGSAALRLHQLIVVNIAIRLVVRRNKTAPVRTGQLLVALHAPQAFNVPYLFLHDYLLGCINSFTARSTLFGRGASPFGLRTRRTGRGGRDRVFRRTGTGTICRPITRRC